MSEYHHLQGRGNNKTHILINWTSIKRASTSMRSTVSRELNENFYKTYQGDFTVFVTDNQSP